MAKKIQKVCICGINKHKKDKPEKKKEWRTAGQLLLEEMVEDIIQDPEELKQVFLDGLDEACIGVMDDAMGGKRKLVYDVALCIKFFMRHGMSEEDAWDFYNYNTFRVIPYANGEGYAPVFINMVDYKAVKKANAGEKR